METESVNRGFERGRQRYMGAVADRARQVAGRVPKVRRAHLGDPYAERLSQGLGWLSVGLGVALLLAPHGIARLTGMPPRSGLLRLTGLRELIVGAGILTQRQRTPWLWGRVAGDTMDMAMLVPALMPGNPGRNRALTTLMTIAGITALDTHASQRVSRAEHGVHGGVRTARDVLVEHAVTINKSPDECYGFWRDFENLPRFMQHLESVKVGDSGISHWVAKAPAGTRVEWDAEVIEDRPNELISWRSREGSEIQHAGTVRFERAPGGRGTVVRVRMHYTPPAGQVGVVLAKLFRQEPDMQIREDLRRFKQVLEAGEIATTVGQPSGPRSLLARATRTGRTSVTGRQL